MEFFFFTCYLSVGYRRQFKGYPGLLRSWKNHGISGVLKFSGISRKVMEFWLNWEGSWKRGRQRSGVFMQYGHGYFMEKSWNFVAKITWQPWYQYQCIWVSTQIWIKVLQWFIMVTVEWNLKHIKVSVLLRNWNQSCPNLPYHCCVLSATLSEGCRTLHCRRSKCPKKDPLPVLYILTTRLGLNGTYSSFN